MIGVRPDDLSATLLKALLDRNNHKYNKYIEQLNRRIKIKQIK